MLRAVKIFMSLVALLVAAVATAMTAGMFNVPPTVIGIATAGGILLGYLGIAPFSISAAVSRVLTGVALFIGALVTWHASVVSTAVNPHPWIWHVIGVVAILSGVISKGPIQPTPAPVDPAPPAAK